MINECKCNASLKELFYRLACNIQAYEGHSRDDFKNQRVPEVL